MKVEVIIQEVKTMSDGGFRLKVDVNELSPEQALELFSYKGQAVEMEMNPHG